AENIWRLILHPEDAEAATRLWSECVRDKKVFEMEYRYRMGRTDTFHWHLGRALPIKDDKGEVIRWFGTCTDIHKQKMTEVELENAKSALAKAATTLEKKVASRT